MNTRIFYVTDLHGSEICFNKFVSAATFYKADVIINAGDLTGKMLVPISEKPDGTYSSWFMGSEVITKSEKEAADIELKIRNSGYYPFRTTPEELTVLDQDKKKLDDLFTKIMVDNVKRWVDFAAETLKGSKVKCFISPGNDDRWEIDKSLDSSDTIMNPELKVVDVDGYHEMISLGWANHTPWNSPREFDEDKLLAKMEELIAQLKHKENSIFNFHCPPYSTGIDSAPMLDSTKKPITSGGQVMMGPVGSTATRDVIMKHQPLVGLHGHIHESKGQVALGKTKCFNPGSEYGTGILKGLILNLSEKGIKSYIFTSG